MIEAGPGEGEKEPLATPTQAPHDFSVIQGFQVVGGEHRAVDQDAEFDDGWRERSEARIGDARSAYSSFRSISRLCFPMTASFVGWAIRSPGSPRDQTCLPPALWSWLTKPCLQQRGIS